MVNLIINSIMGMQKHNFVYWVAVIIVAVFSIKKYFYAFIMN